MVARVLKPPTPLDFPGGVRCVFLAGSIEMGQAEPWQSAVEDALAGEDVVILNPRRDEWDSSVNDRPTCLYSAPQDAVQRSTGWDGICVMVVDQRSLGCRGPSI